uniref:Uncharacterized protein n=1 Tax=Anguilla anguilla TaxID=7936 RepID=A0A0E9ST20_ANGAN
MYHQRFIHQDKKNTSYWLENKYAKHPTQYTGGESF